MTNTWVSVDAVVVLVLVISVAVAAGYWWYRWEMWLDARAHAALDNTTYSPAVLGAPVDTHATVIDLAAARRQRAMQAASS